MASGWNYRKPFIFQLEVVAGECNVLKIPSIPFAFEIIRPVAA
jgi:hypothetical protein